MGVQDSGYRGTGSGNPAIIRGPEVESPTGTGLGGWHGLRSIPEVTPTESAMRTVLLALIAISSPLAAADGNDSHGCGECGAALFDRRDADGDGSITRAEFLAPHHGEGVSTLR
jgi:hypothetical protein